MRVLTLRFEVEEGRAATVEAGVRKVLSAVEQEQPKGIRYTWCKLPDGVTFVGLLELDDRVDNPLPAIAAGRELQQNLASWATKPPIREELELIGSYVPQD